ncbi:hypothetical protein [Solirubrobacter pauli]|uniref:hypothetical protein n=1 Tax=Solirubrobacter pauli TaxID=166793 RepID=UPI0011C39475|nr:hypothetical protein [Solirubrobacter pauli]
MAYWLVNSGTKEEPWTSDLHRLYREWNETEGPVQKFPETQRPATMRHGDILIHRAVGSPDRIVAVAEVCSAVQPASKGSRWAWQVQRRLLHVCVDLSAAPTLAEINEEGARRLRVFKAMPISHGQMAHRLIKAAGTPWDDQA